jgi:aminopeptidase
MVAKAEKLYRRQGERIFYSDEMVKKITNDIANVSLDLQPGNKLFIQFHPGAEQFKEGLVRIARERGVEIRIQEYDPIKKAKELKELESGQPHDFSGDVAEFKESADWAEKVAYLYAYEDPQAFQEVDPTILKSYNAALGEIKRNVANNKRRILTHLPTLAEAKIEKMSFKDYVHMFYDACNRDWEKVIEAQDILIDEILNPGKNLELFADFDEEKKEYKTHLTMDIEGMTFANSTIYANYPGSEVFSAPVARTISGKLTLPYPVMFGGKKLPNLTLVFDKGKVISHSVEGNPELEIFVASVLDADEGARQVGEVAFGTNPSFYKPMLNALFVEKVGGSFHIAIGESYKMKKYAGRDVKVDNGVESNHHIHEDLTRMMTSKYGGGKVVLDGNTIQENGIFKDDRLGILNPTDRI